MDWTDHPGEVNERLRTLWTAIDLAHADGKLAPVKAQWVPGVYAMLFEGQDRAEGDATHRVTRAERAKAARKAGRA